MVLNLVSGFSEVTWTRRIAVRIVQNLDDGLLLLKQRRDIDVHAILQDQLTIDPEDIGKWQSDFAAVVSGVRHLTFAGDGIAICNDLLQVVSQSGERGKKALDRHTYFCVPGNRWRRTEAKRCVFMDETQKALRIHRIDGREELLEIYTVEIIVGHC